ncbi:MAG: hypothetical protein DMG85_02065 [Acidobacteria bacterium]|nr:MAG: hypothetical protein DMG85_02065 [Acidobacteriota bacterium]
MAALKYDLSIPQQVGQLLIVGFDGTATSSRLGSLLTRLQPAGVILFARNITGALQTYSLLKDCQERVSTPLFACVDMEGGSVDRLRNVIGPSPSAADVFATRDRKLFRKHGKLIGECCRALGFNTDFAPVVDLAFEASRTVMASRVVSADPKQVIVYAREFLAGLRSAGMLGAAKHFPGLGEANLDTHYELPSVSKSWNKLWAQDLAPYRTIARELNMVLVGHASYPKVTDKGLPASLSKKWITSVLREKDLCLICHQRDYVIRSYEALIREAERDSSFARRVTESATRVLAFKKKSRELKRHVSPPTPDRLEKRSRQLWEFSEQVRLETLSRLDRA